MLLCIIYLTTPVSNAYSNNYTITLKIVHLPSHQVLRGLGLDGSEFTKPVIDFIFLLY